MLDGYLLHFDLHGDDMGPLGLYCSTAIKAGVDPGLAIAALAGHSPSTAGAVEALRRIFDAAVAAGWSPVSGLASVDELRALGPDVAAALDDYLDEYGWRVVTGYDLDSLTVHELPEALLTNVIASGTDRGATDGDAAAEALRTQVPFELLSELDAGLAEARVALDLRDDNGPINVQWPTGLLRRALLETGRRLRDRGQLSEPDLAVELTLAEAIGALRGSTTLSPVEIADRAATRATDSAVVPPATLGSPDPEPDLSAFPAALAAVTGMARTAVSLLERNGPTSEVEGAVAHGLGVGSVAWRGTARVARSPEDALGVIEPGDVLVVPFTTPAYNAVLSVAGAVVTEEGGALSHAAVLARELGIPAVIGAGGAVSAIPDGAEVEVDPVAGTVRLLGA
jgi:pyruvate,water dikinase